MVRKKKLAKRSFTYSQRAVFARLAIRFLGGADEIRDADT